MRINETIRELRDLVPLRSELRALLPSKSKRKSLLAAILEVDKHVECPHNESHILNFVVEMMRFSNERSLEPGGFVEAGCFKGGSTAKFSLVAKHLGRKLTVLDSFEGIPPNVEPHHESIFGYSIQEWFEEGTFRGTLAEVTQNVENYGDIETCQFVPGWFDDTLPGLDIQIAGAYIDVDLASSTRSCLRYLYPLLVPGGFLISQDGDFPLVIEVFDDDQFWEDSVGVPKPKILGLGTSKMLKVYKDG
jgi:O-methyltransferase